MSEPKYKKKELVETRLIKKEKLNKTSKVLKLPIMIWRAFDNIHAVSSCVTITAATW